MLLCNGLCREQLQHKGMVVYCGHGAGERLLRREAVAKLPRCAAVMLMGCSSGRLHPNGDFEPTGMAAAFLEGRCPALVANLWDVTDRDIDRLTEKLLRTFTDRPGASGDDLAVALVASREECKFRGITGSAPVLYGLPVRALQ
jgi:separase